MTKFKISTMAIILAFVCALPQKVAMACPGIFALSHTPQVSQGQSVNVTVDQVSIDGCIGVLLKNGSNCHVRVFMSNARDGEQSNLCFPFASIFNGQAPWPTNPTSTDAYYIDVPLVGNNFSFQIPSNFTDGSTCCLRAKFMFAFVCDGILSPSYSPEYRFNICEN